ncbi:GMC family oxidoreductase N-terminal domain-containing protein [Paracoccus sp. Z118]|uniref:GMC family oxidoreductase n=1 Tax=Paracoccus sp. Z118 TaxID=2851017 RepID=UPI001C2C8A41|nr:GMC family oxidoreductase N-terminal domain-containing protein [Paracoccus sp. Z118]MBV0891971.1 GMC family oxidoreductase N-terminal domain-containing protein [Paracoccus sp. Z118]
MEFDVVIAGAGSAGCVLAARLSENPRVRVALVEAGGRDNYHWIHVPIGYLYCIGNPRTDWMYRTAPEPRLNGRQLLYPRGRVLGGCSSINGMLYLRGQAADYDGWRQMGCTGWGWDDVLPLFRKSEDYFDGPSEHHGAGGPWRIERQRLRWDILDDWAKAAEAAGIPCVDDFNTGDNEGVGYFKVSQKGGLRVSAARAFLRPAMRRPNLTVLTGRQVRRVVFDGNRATGLELFADGAVETLRAGQVVLSAGAIGTPQILQLSGIGPGALLQDMGIPVLRDAPVGENLQDHLQIRCAWKVTGARTLNQLARRWWGKGMIGAEYLLRRTGPMSMAPSQLGAFAKSSPDVATPDLEWHVQPLSLEAFGQPLHGFPAITASVCHLRPESRGHVRITSPDAMAAPRIAPNYLSTPGDRATAARAIRLTREIMAQEPLSRYRPEEFKPGPGPDDDAALAEAAGRIGSTIFHPVGTARMGADPGSVVDPALRVRGVEGLRVVDASIMPTITSGNTNAPTIMIAEKAASLMAAEMRGI